MTEQKNVIDLRELNKMSKMFRSCHKALKRLRDEKSDFYVSFYGTVNRSGQEIPIVSKKAMRTYLITEIECEMGVLRKRFAQMGIDPLVVDGRPKKKSALTVAK